MTKTIYLFSLYVLLSQCRPQSQEEFALCLFHILCVQMDVNEAKFERNSSLEYYRMTYIQTIQAREVSHEIQSSYLQLEKRMYTRFSRLFQLFYILEERFTRSMGLCTLMKK